MFVPIVPVVPNTTVVNKVIVYSDTVLPLKDTGSNLIVTSINNVSESSLEKCLKTIFESNPNVIFNTIQYSKNDKKVYFYTNQEITVKKFEESKYKKYEPMSSRFQILEEIKRIITTNKIKNNDCISLYDAAVLMSQMNYKYNSIKDSYNSQINYLIKQKFGSSSISVIYDFDHINNKLGIGFNYFGVGYDYAKITFIKEDGDLYILDSQSCWSKEVLAAIGTKLSELYDEFIKFSDYKKEHNYCVKPINSNFFVSISSYGVSIFTKSTTNQFMKDFELTFPSYVNEYKYNCNSTTIINAFRGYENEIFKRIFVKIQDCPKRSQAMLYEIRQNQLAKEEKKEKRLELTRKIFPFLKK